MNLFSGASFGAGRHPHRGRAVEVWAFDEHRLGLKPLSRRVWARRGERPVALSHHKYRWLYVWGFVHPASGRVEWWLANRVGVGLFQAVLDAFAAGAGADKIVIRAFDIARGAVGELALRLRQFRPPKMKSNLRTTNNVALWGYSERKSQAGQRSGDNELT